MSEEEIAEKLRLLKHYSREFDANEARWKATGGERAAYKAMCEAERNYVALFDWLWKQGISVWWDREKQEYIIKSLYRCQAPKVLSSSNTASLLTQQYEHSTRDGSACE